jgi:hypothetical protein
MLHRYVASGILLAQSKNKEGENDGTSEFSWFKEKFRQFRPVSMWLVA